MIRLDQKEKQNTLHQNWFVFELLIVQQIFQCILVFAESFAVTRIQDEYETMNLIVELRPGLLPTHICYFNLRLVFTLIIR